MRTRAVLLADTHIGPARPSRRLPDTVYALLGTADVVLHAGDVTDGALLLELGAIAPTYAVLGNNDVSLELPDRRVVDVGGVAVAMIHDSGPAPGRGRRLRRWFPDADVVVFGHSHLPWHEVVDGQHHLNPGSPTERRRAPAHTAGVLDVVDADIAALGIVEV